MTLGNYDTEAEAKRDCERFTKEGFYKKVCVEKKDIPDPPEEDPRTPAAAPAPAAKKAAK